MIGYVTLGTNDLPRAAAFYDAIGAELGVRRFLERDTFVTWGKPVQEKCPECGGPYMVEKWLKAGPVLQCPNADCKHKQPMLVPVEALAQ